MVQQLRVTGTGSQFTEIAGGTYQPATEMGSPDTVDHNSGGKWIVVSRQGAGQFEATAPLGVEGRLGATGENCRHGPWCNLGLLGRISLEVDLDVVWFVIT